MRFSLPISTFSIAADEASNLISLSERAPILPPAFLISCSFSNVRFHLIYSSNHLHCQANIYHPQGNQLLEIPFLRSVSLDVSVFCSSVCHPCCHDFIFCNSLYIPGLSFLSCADCNVASCSGDSCEIFILVFTHGNEPVPHLDRACHTVRFW